MDIGQGPVAGFTRKSGEQGIALKAGPRMGDIGGGRPEDRRLGLVRGRTFVDEQHPHSRSISEIRGRRSAILSSALQYPGNA